MPLVRFCEVGACREHADLIAQVKGWRTAFELKPMAICTGHIPTLTNEGHEVFTEQPALPAERS